VRVGVPVGLGSGSWKRGVEGVLKLRREIKGNKSEIKMVKKEEEISSI
jgi:hypothetical protein